MHQQLHQVNHILDENIVVFVAVCVVGVNLYYFDYTATTVVVPFMTLMCCLMVVMNMGLKRLLNHARPPGALKASAGMPSNHAASLTFLAILACEGLERCQANEANGGAMKRGLTRGRGLPLQKRVPTPGAMELLQGFILVVAFYGSALRVICGDHTAAQVVVGGAVGLSSAVLVMRLNYHGYAGLCVGGRIDELGYPIKRVLMMLAMAIIALTVKAIVSSYKRYVLGTKHSSRERRGIKK